MRALTVVPRGKESARLDDIPEPPAAEGSVLVATRVIGVCGTDAEIVAGKYGEAPPGKERLVLGHESLGTVLEAPAGSGLAKGDAVVAIVRQPDPVPCPSCAAGEWDMCRNGRYTEHGIRGLDGFCRERYRIEPRFAVKIDAALGDAGVFLEPASVVAKAWEQIERIGARAVWTPKKVLVTGAGPIGLLAALMGVQRKLEVHVFDRHGDGPKPKLVRDLGGIYHSANPSEAGAGADVIIECTGSGPLVYEVLKVAAPDGIVCLTGVSSGGRTVGVDLESLNKELVLENNVVFGTVNANRRHFEAGARALAAADPAWLARLITRRVPLDRWQEALKRRPDDVKPVLVVGEA